MAEMTEMTVKQGLQAALDLFGPNGEFWAKGSEKDGVPDGFYCALTSCGKVAVMGNHGLINNNPLFIEMNIVKTNLETACMYAVKAVSLDPRYQDND